MTSKIKVPKRARNAWKHCDDQAVRVYSAEQYGEACSPATLSNRDVPAFLIDICRSPLWKRYWGKTKLVVKWRSPGSSAIGGVTTDDEPFIQLPKDRFGRSIHTIIHEMAHAMSQQGNHGPKFCTMLLRLTKHFEGAQYAAMLRQRLHETGALKRTKKKPIT
jgi:hypothetical protein